MANLQKSSKKFRFWFDLCHPPHVLFFAPQIQMLQEMGHRTYITIRDRFQVADLCNMSHIPYYTVGTDYGKSFISKGRGVAQRTFQLFMHLKNMPIDLAVSQGSSYQVLAAAAMGISSVFMTDYEHIYLGIARRLASYIAVPEIIPESVFVKKHVPSDKLIRYPGLKEDVYLETFKPENNFLKQWNISDKSVVVTVRPPLAKAHYFNPLSEQLYHSVMDHLIEKSNLTIVLLPRSESGRKNTAALMERSKARIVVPETTINGLDLIYHSDLVISGGGTMNREAAAMGVPVYTIFQGPIASMDSHLSKINRLHFIRNKSDVKKLVLRKRKKRMDYINKNSNVKEFLVNHLIKCANN